jgi:hypothetical protein
LFEIDANIKWTDGTPVAGTTLTVGTPRTMIIPANVANYGIKGAGYVIHSKAATGIAGRYGTASAAECYRISIQKQQLTITALPGSTPTAFANGDCIQRLNNRNLTAGSTAGFAADGVTWTGSGTYTADTTSPNTVSTIATAGFMNGLPDLFPADFDANGNRMGINRYFDGEPSRNEYTIDRAGDAILRSSSQSVADFVFSLIRNAQLAAPGAPWLCYMHPDVLNVMSLQDNATNMVIRNVMPVGAYTFQKGIEVLSFTLGGKKYDNIVLDGSLPTNRIYVTVEDIVEYNAWTQTYAQIDQFVLDTYGSFPDKIENIAIDDFLTSSSLDWGRRIAVGSPYNAGTTMVMGKSHPSTAVPVDFEELGNVFCEQPHLMSVGNLGLQIVDPSTYV